MPIIRAALVGIGVIVDIVKGARQASKLDKIERIKKRGDENAARAEESRRRMRERKP